MKTPWFRSDREHPKRKGEYEWGCTYAPAPSRITWDGERWKAGGQFDRRFVPCDSCKWRGFTEKQ